MRLSGRSQLIVQREVIGQKIKEDFGILRKYKDIWEKVSKIMEFLENF
jgi:hypothetical protein